MAEIPKFKLYSEGEPDIERAIQPALAFRPWGDLSKSEKETALQQLRNLNWVRGYSNEILQTIEYLNDAYLRRCPGKKLHLIPPRSGEYGSGSDNDMERRQTALLDFESIFLTEKSDALVLTMLSRFARA